MYLRNTLQWKCLKTAFPLTQKPITISQRSYMKTNNQNKNKKFRHQKEENFVYFALEMWRTKSKSNKIKLRKTRIIYLKLTFSLKISIYI